MIRMTAKIPFVVFILAATSLAAACTGQAPPAPGTTSDAPASSEDQGEDRGTKEDGSAADRGPDVVVDGSDTSDSIDGTFDGSATPGDTSPKSDAKGSDGASSAPEENLLANPGFESVPGAEGCPNDWSCVTHNPSNAGTFSTDQTESYRGDRSIRWTGRQTPITVVKQTLSSEPGKRYDVSVWVRGRNLETDPFVQILFDGGGDVLNQQKFRPESNSLSGWTQITGATSEAPAGTDQVRFNLSTNRTSGTVWWDRAVMIDLGGSETDPPDPADFEVVEARGQTVTIQDGQVYENKLIDLTTGGDFTIDARNATNWTIRNVGFKGRKQTPGTLFGVSDSEGGTSVMKNIYLGDGSDRNGGQATCNSTSNCTHGPVGIYVGPEHSGHLRMERINVQGWPNNGIYGSAPGSNGNGQDGTIHIDSSYGANNYVSSFRLAGGSGNEITDSVAFNDGGDYDGRPIWVWKPGPVTLEDVDLAEGGFSHALVAGSYNGGTVVRLRNSQMSGSIQRRSGSTVDQTNVGSSPDLSLPAGVPASPEEAAGGRAGQ